jgi:hypothetical protein
MGGKREAMMKNNQCKAHLIILVAGLITFFPAAKPVSAADWEELPPLVFQEYVEVETVIAPNPYSERSNDFLVVTKYEEGEKAGAAGNKHNSGAEKPITSLNVYLVTGLILLDGGEVGIPYHTSLIVSLRSTGKKSSGQTVQQWVLSDSDGDGELDEARFQKVATNTDGNTIRSGPVEIPQDRIRNYQAYYEEASRELNSKADISLGD